jgi:hypothetical protein
MESNLLGRDDSPTHDNATQDADDAHDHNHNHVDVIEHHCRLLRLPCARCVFNELMSRPSQAPLHTRLHPPTVPGLARRPQG